MTITGLENDYYLAGNDIWLSVSEITSYLEVSVLGFKYTLYPNPAGTVEFNISQIIRPLFNNDEVIKSVAIKFTSGPDVIDLTKFFLSGKQKQKGENEWFLSASSPLIVGKWIEWVGVTLPGFAKRIMADTIVDFIPTDRVFINLLDECNYRIVRFKNSFNVYQFYIFERFEIKPKTKAGKKIDVISHRLRDDNFKFTSTEKESTITFFSKTPSELQEVVEDLIYSNEVHMLEEGVWKKLGIENNDIIWNNWEQKFDNKIDFTIW